eukprot:5543715-Prymnesium_polylepis.1
MDIATFDVATLSLGATRTNAMGGRYVPTLINGRDAIESKLRIDSEEGLRMPFGVSEPYGGGEPGPKLPMPLEPTEAFEAVARRIDAVVPQLVQPRAQELFGSSKTPAQLQDMYRPLVHEGHNGYSCTIPVKVKVGGTGMRTQVDVATPDGFAPATSDVLVRGARVLVLVRLGSIWIQGRTQYGITLEAMRVVAYPPAPQRPVEADFPVRPALPGATPMEDE